MTDLVQRLRRLADQTKQHTWTEAADEIERLRGTIQAIRISNDALAGANTERANEIERLQVQLCDVVAKSAAKSDEIERLRAQVEIQKLRK